VDLLNFRINPKLTLEEQAVSITALVLIKSLPGDEEEHHIQVTLVRPEEEITELFDVSRTAPSVISGLPGGLNLVVQVAVVPTQMGIHYLTLAIDGTEITRAPFTLREREQESENN
jgi:hypothetical protein